jgi:hypothetical protein
MIPKGYTLGADGEYVCKFCFGRGCLSCPPLPPVLKEQPTEPLLSLSKAALEDHESDAFQVFKN